ncbi:hypothetical protein D3C80_1042410 [compost metagenome]
MLTGEGFLLRAPGGENPWLAGGFGRLDNPRDVFPIPWLLLVYTPIAANRKVSWPDEYAIHHRQRENGIDLLERLCVFDDRIATGVGVLLVDPLIRRIGELRGAATGKTAITQRG